MSTTVHAAHRRPLSLVAVRGVLIIRCLVDLWFAWGLFRTPAGTAPALGSTFAAFAVTDGVIAFVLAGLTLFAGLHRGVSALAALDAVLRVAAADALHVGPGIPYFALTIILYVGVLAALAFLYGLFEAIEARRLHTQLGRNTMSTTLALAGVATMVLAVAQFFLLPALSTIQHLLVAGIVVQALTMLGIALGAGAVVRESHR